MNWFILTSTWHAGTKWFASHMAEHTDTVIRHNLVPLDFGDSIFGRAVPDHYSPDDDEHMRQFREKYALADYFEFLEKYFEEKCCGMTDFHSASTFHGNTIAFPKQFRRLEENNFRIANIVMNPIKLIEITNRIFIHQGGTPNLPIDPNIRESFCLTTPNKNLFFESAIYQASNLQIDLSSAKSLNIKIYAMEHMLTNEDYYSEMVSWFSSGAVNLTRDALDKIYEDKSTPHQRSIEPASPFAHIRDPFREPEYIFKSWNPEQQEAVIAAFKHYGIFEKFEEFGYDFSFIKK